MIENLDRVMKLLEKQKTMCNEASELFSERSNSETDHTLKMIYHQIAFLNLNISANADTSIALLDAINQLITQLNEIFRKIPKTEEIDRIKKVTEQLEVKVSKTLEPIAKVLHESQEREKRGGQIYD